MNCINKLICLSICLCAAACGNPSSKNNDMEFTDNVSEALANGGKIDLDDLGWTREPASYTIDGDTVSITTAPHTDLWQRTYYHFRNDNAPGTPSSILANVYISAFSLPTTSPPMNDAICFAVNFIIVMFVFYYCEDNHSAQIRVVFLYNLYHKV